MSQPIGVFDSGFGGLTVASVLSKQLPCESIFYFGDTARCPYGERSQDQVKHFSYEIAQWLVRKQSKLVIIACNTATAASLKTLQEYLPAPVIGVIQAGAKGCIQATKNKRIGILATQGTVDSMSYVESIHAMMPEAEVFQQPAGPFVHIVENALMNHSNRSNLSDADLISLFDTSETRAEVKRIVAPLVEAGVDTICLGCTHFPLLAPIIAEEIPGSITLVNPANGVADEVKAMLGDVCEGDPVYRFATTAQDIEKFAYAIQKVFPYEANSVEHVPVADLQELDSDKI